MSFPRPVDPEHTPRAEAYRLWMQAPMPMVTLVRTLDVSRLVRRDKGRGFNLLMCWCIGKAAEQLKEFYLLPVGEELLEYDRLAVSLVVETEMGGISSCDVPVSPELREFEAGYRELTEKVRKTGQPYDLSASHMVIGTSALKESPIDAAMNIYAGIYNNPFALWGRYRRSFFKYSLPLSFQFHHSQMDGREAARFLELLQREINSIK